MAVTGTNLDQTTIETLITLGDAEIDTWLADANVTGSANSKLEAASIYMLRIQLIMRGRETDMPNSISMGSMSRSDNQDAKVSDYYQKAKDLVNSYIKSQMSGRFKTQLLTSPGRCDDNLPAFDLDANSNDEYPSRASLTEDD